MKNLNNYITEKFKINSKTVSNQHEDFIDLGLPSGLLWSKHNYGIDKNNKFGCQKTYNTAIKIKFEDGSRIPTKEDFIELDENCNHKYDEENGIKGFRFVSKNNKESIFLPYCHTENQGQGFYWSSTEYNHNNAYTLWFSNYGNNTKIKSQNTNYKSNLFYIRTVLDK